MRFHRHRTSARIGIAPRETRISNLVRSVKNDIEIFKAYAHQEVFVAHQVMFQMSDTAVDSGVGGYDLALASEAACCL
jgi:hypothetical protein